MLGRLAERDFILALPASTVPGETEWSFCHELERDLVLGDAGSRAGAPPPAFRRPVAGGADAAAPEQRAARAAGQPVPRRAATCAAPASVSWPPATRPLRRLRHERARGLFLRGVRAAGRRRFGSQDGRLPQAGRRQRPPGRPHEALAHFGEMLRIAWRLDLPAKGGAAHARIGRLHRALGDFRRALSHLELAHVLFELAGDRPGIAAVLDDIGRIHLLKGNFEQSMTYHRAALALREQLRDERGRALTLSWMGLCEMQRGNLVPAGDYFRRALALQPGHPRRARHRVLAAGPRAGWSARPGRPAGARTRLEEARALARQMGERLYECHIGLQIGECLLRERRPVRRRAGVRGRRDHRAAVRRPPAGRRGRPRRWARRAWPRATCWAPAITPPSALDRGAGDGRLAAGGRRPARAGQRRGPGRARATPTTAGRARCSTARSSCWRGSAPSWSWGGRCTAYADFEDSTGRNDAASELRSWAEGIRQRPDRLARCRGTLTGPASRDAASGRARRAPRDPASDVP